MGLKSSQTLVGHFYKLCTITVLANLPGRAQIACGWIGICFLFYYLAEYLPEPKMLGHRGEGSRVGTSLTSAFSMRCWSVIFSNEASLAVCGGHLQSWQEPGLFGDSLEFPLANNSTGCNPTQRLETRNFTGDKRCLVGGSVPCIIWWFHLDHPYMCISFRKFLHC